MTEKTERKAANGAAARITEEELREVERLDAQRKARALPDSAEAHQQLSWMAADLLPRLTADVRALQAKLGAETARANLIQTHHEIACRELDSLRAESRPAPTPERAATVIAFLRGNFFNDGAEGESVHLVCDMLETALAPAVSDAAPPPVLAGHVSIPRAILERLAKAAASDASAREARWAAERILQQADLAAEPARHDAAAARAMAAVAPHDRYLHDGPRETCPLPSCATPDPPAPAAALSGSGQ